MGAVDDFISPAVVARLREALAASDPRADLSRVREAEDAVVGLKLRRRVDIVRESLAESFPGGYLIANRVIVEASADPRFTGWMIWPVTEFVASRALESGTIGDYDSAMALLARLTPRLTSEFAVRPLIEAKPERAIGIIQTWTGHESEHVRRLATEGSRAYLPWAKRVPWLIDNPLATRGIVDATYRDASEFVRRSVANHLNDLSRVDSAIVTEIAGAWAASPDANTRWVLRRGLRTLTKRGDPAALALLGYSGEGIRVARPHVEHHLVPWGGRVAFDSLVTNTTAAPADVEIDYAIGFRRADGTVRPKTFTLASRRIAAGESVRVAKTHSFRPITTRRYYPGSHHVTVHANGVASPPREFELGRPGADESTTAGVET